MDNFCLMLSKQVHKITLNSKGARIKTSRFSWTALPLLHSMLGAVSASTKKDDVYGVQLS